MNQFTILTSHVMPLLVDNIDTDQIIPARFLKTIHRSGLGDQLFADWRYQSDGSLRPDFVLNNPLYAGAQILFTGDNFGCGSSREHATWALKDYGFRAIISTSFADIFQINSLKNGILPVSVDGEIKTTLIQLLSDQPLLNLTIDLTSQGVIFPNGRKTTFPIDVYSKNCLLRGIDQLEYLLSLGSKITAFEIMQV